MGRRRVAVRRNRSSGRFWTSATYSAAADDVPCAKPKKKWCRRLLCQRFASFRTNPDRRLSH